MIPSLNGLRAVAIIFVLVSHFVQVQSVPVFLKTILSPIAQGELGVRLFFVISGFLITWLLLKEKKKNGKINLKRFYVRRSLRIFPVFYGYVIFVCLMSEITGIGIDNGVVLSSILYLQNFAPWGSDWRLAHSWSLAVEEQFYIIWPTLFLFIRQGNYKLLILATAIIGSLARIVSYKFPIVSTPLLLPFVSNLDFLAGGCILAYIQFNHQEYLSKFLSRISSVGIAAGIVLIVFLHKLETHPVLDRIFLPITGTISIIYFMTLVAWSTNPRNQANIICRVLNSQIANGIGMLSYGLYVWQQYFFVPPYHASSAKDWTQFPLNIGLLVLSVAGSYYIIERPFLKIKERFSS